MPPTDEGTPKATTRDKVVQATDGTEVSADVAQNHAEEETLPNVVQDKPENDAPPAEQTQGLGLILDDDDVSTVETSNLAAADGTSSTIVKVSAISTTVIKGDDGRDQVVE